MVGPAVPPEVRERLLLRFGPAAGAWCDGLPELVAALAGRWGLTVLSTGGGGTARVFRCERDGATVWLKVTPDPEVAAQEATALRAWAALPSVVGLLAADPPAGALLLADVHPGTPLRSHGWRPADVAPLLAELRTVPADRAPELPRLAERIGFLFDLTERRAPGLTPAGARGLALELAGSGPSGLVHGDLHPANVLAGPDGPVAIDPRPCLGDPHFDLVDWAVDGVTDHAALHRRIAELAPLVPGTDPDRVLAWCRAAAPLIAAPRTAAGRRDPQTAFLTALATG